MQEAFDVKVDADSVLALDSIPNARNLTITHSLKSLHFAGSGDVSLLLNCTSCFSPWGQPGPRPWGGFKLGDIRLSACMSRTIQISSPSTSTPTRSITTGPRSSSPATCCCASSRSCGQAASQLRIRLVRFIGLSEFALRWSLMGRSTTNFCKSGRALTLWLYYGG